MGRCLLVLVSSASKQTHIPLVQNAGRLFVRIIVICFNNYYTGLLLKFIAPYIMCTYLNILIFCRCSVWPKWCWKIYVNRKVAKGVS
jgi:hypothetical protein